MDSHPFSDLGEQYPGGCEDFNVRWTDTLSIPASAATIETTIVPNCDVVIIERTIGIDDCWKLTEGEADLSTDDVALRFRVLHDPADILRRKVRIYLILIRTIFGLTGSIGVESVESQMEILMSEVSKIGGIVGR